MRLRMLVAVLALAVLSAPEAARAERARIATLSGTVALVRPASPMALADMSFMQRLLDGLANRESPLELATPLTDGDGLRTEEAGAAVMLECASGATQTLTGPFDVVLRIRADGMGCKIEVRDGQATATTASDPEAMPDGKPEQQYGDVTLGASSTMFGVAVSGKNVECFVIDGAITATRANAPVWALNSGQQLTVNPQAISAVTPITEARLVNVANTYARLDVAQMPAARREESLAQLKTRYLEAFRKPEDPEARAQLVQSYSALSVTPNAARAYQARKQTRLLEKSVQDRAVIQPGHITDKMIVAPQ